MLVSPAVPVLTTLNAIGKFASEKLPILNSYCFWYKSGVLPVISWLIDPFIPISVNAPLANDLWNLNENFVFFPMKLKWAL